MIKEVGVQEIIKKASEERFKYESVVTIKECAKILKVKNWWTKKKSVLLDDIAEIVKQHTEEQEELAKEEIKVQPTPEVEQKPKNRKKENKGSTTKDEESKEEPHYNINDLANDFNLTPKKVRWIIRKKGEVVKQDTRWKWYITNEDDMKAYNDVKEVLSNHVNKKK